MLPLLIDSGLLRPQHLFSASGISLHSGRQQVQGHREDRIDHQQHHADEPGRAARIRDGHDRQGAEQNQFGAQGQRALDHLGSSSMRLTSLA